MNKESPASAAKSSTSDSKSKQTKTSQHASRYLVVGTSIAVFNYGFYTILANLIINNNDLLWLSSLISTVVTTIIAYLLHSKITWKERPITKASLYKFFIWNAILSVISPLLTQFFSLFTPLYELAYNICVNLGIPFSYEFVFSTGAFILTAIVTTIINFFLYDRFVFGKSNATIES